MATRHATLYQGDKIPMTKYVLSICIVFVVVSISASQEMNTIASPTKDSLKVEKIDSPGFTLCLDIVSMYPFGVTYGGLLTTDFFSIAIGAQYRYPLYKVSLSGTEIVGFSIYPRVGIGLHSLLEMQLKAKILSLFCINVGIAHQVFFNFNHSRIILGIPYSFHDDYAWRQKQIGQQLFTIVGVSVEVTNCFFIEWTIRNPWLDTPTIYITSRSTLDNQVSMGSDLPTYTMFTMGISL